MRRRKKLSVVPVLILVAVLLFSLILLIEKPMLLPVPERETVLGEGGAGGIYLPKDPEKQLIVLTKFYELFGEEHPQLLYDLPVSWGFAREVDGEEQQVRQSMVETAKAWLGANEAEGSHRPIVDIYNSHTPLARDYAAGYEDSWCSIFVSTVAIQNDLTDIIPTECGCQAHVELFRDLGRWEEADDYVPLPGDIVFYHLECADEGDCRYEADHVGIVVGTAGDFIQVIEGNHEDAVGYRLIKVDFQGIRGYGLPAY